MSGKQNGKIALMKKRSLKGIAFVCFALLIVCGSPNADENQSFSFKKLMMPGDVIDGHAEYEQECGKCHGTFNNISQTTLCLDCHEDVAADIQQAQGFHGLPADAKNHECRDCHSDHIGRQGDIVKLDNDSFDHLKTDFELKGKHIDAPCTSCHLPDKKHREAPDQCVDCHEKDDRHRGVLGKECQDCHSSKGWQETRFDHDDTEFPLLGKHQETQCNACHPDEKYTATPTRCVACHTLNDVHNGKNGEQCSDCHQEKSWGEISFDHDKDTDFKLTGRHDKLACSSCHQDSDLKKELATECIVCHQNDDEHQGRNGKECNSCHVTSSWSKMTFDHDSDTDFTLQGSHNKLSCESCHRDSIKDEELGTGCNDCHQVDDVHDGQEGSQCNNCHGQTGWREQVRFNHDLTTFPLVGMHAVTACESCHTSKVFRDTDNNCIACHQDDDSHNRALSPNCGSCHNPNDWQLWLFNHDKQTDFKLDGSHKELSCNGCHIKPAKTKVKQSSACVACHLNDDVHNRGFGRACERCHVTESFKKIRIQ